MNGFPSQSRDSDARFLGLYTFFHSLALFAFFYPLISVTNLNFLHQEGCEESKRIVALMTLQERFYALFKEDSPQAAGLKFEKILNELFELENLSPRKGFRVIGEQIDGSFELDHATYLVEAKWEKSPISEAALLIFRGKIEGKSAFTRGVFISLNGITKDALHAITQGKQPIFFVIDGYDLSMVLSNRITLPDLLRKRLRILAEEGQLYVPFNQIEIHSTT